MFYFIIQDNVNVAKSIYNYGLVKIGRKLENILMLYPSIRQRSFEIAEVPQWMYK